MGQILSEPVTAMVVERAASESWGASVVTMQGWRKTHEDAHILRCHSTEDFGVFAVLDGHGGHTAAQAAAGMLERQLLQLASERTLEPNELRQAFLTVDDELRLKLPRGDCSGTTVVAAVVTRPQPARFCVHLVHAGDSRAVLRTGKELICSDDHKPAREDERARIIAAGGSVEQGSLPGGPLRVDGALAVSRAMGDFQFKPVELSPELCKVTALPEVRTVSNCSAGDWLLLACDGVFDVFSNEEVRDFLEPRLQHAAGAADGCAVLTELLQLSLERGSKDNCTACLVQLGNKWSPEPHSRELVQGPWARADPSVKQKYAEFFASQGFEEAATAVRTEVRQVQRRCAHPRCTYLVHSNPLNNKTHCCLACRDSRTWEVPLHGPKCQHRAAC